MKGHFFQGIIMTRVCIDTDMFNDCFTYFLHFLLPLNIFEPKTTADQEKMSLGLQRLSEEDPTFVVSSDEETGQTLISGMASVGVDAPLQSIVVGIVLVFAVWIDIVYRRKAGAN